MRFYRSFGLLGWKIGTIHVLGCGASLQQHPYLKPRVPPQAYKFSLSHELQHIHPLERHDWKWQHHWCTEVYNREAIFHVPC